MARTPLGNAMWELVMELKKEREALEAKARTIHEQSSMFLDRDQNVRALLNQAEGTMRASFRLLEVLEEHKEIRNEPSPLRGVWSSYGSGRIRSFRRNA